MQHALDTLHREGIQGVRIEKIARELGVTKGSFYWHFNDLGDLQQSILEFWCDKYSEVVTRHPEFRQGDPVARYITSDHHGS